MKDVGRYLAFGQEQAENLSDSELEIKLDGLSAKIYYRMIMLVFFIVAGLAGMLAGAVVFGGPFAIVFGLAGFFAGSIVYIGVSFLRAEVRGLVSGSLVKGVLAEVFEISAYEPENHIDKKKIEAVSLMPFDWDVCEGNGYIKGEYKGVGFVFSNITLYLPRSKRSIKSFFAGGMFEGQWLIFELNADVPFLTIRRRVSLPDRVKKSEFKTDNDEFEKKYMIETRDPRFAAEICNPRFIEYLSGIDDRSGARVYAGFSGSEAHIAVDSGRRFFNVKTTKNLRSVSVNEIRDQIRGEVRYITDIIDELLRNENISQLLLFRHYSDTN